jgi:DNA-binding NarL/FixJ family response regulator
MIRILIADDHAIVRAGLKQFISDQRDMQVAGEASTGSEAIALVRASEFDVVLLDISMPDKNGIDTLKTLKQVRPELPILMLSGYAEDQYAVNLLRAGAAGYLNKEAASTQLVGAIRTVVLGRKFVSPTLAQILADGVTGDADRPAARRVIAARVPDLLQDRRRRRRIEDRRRAAPVGQDHQYLSDAGSGKDGDEVERGPHVLCDQERAYQLTVATTLVGGFAETEKYRTNADRQAH